MPGLNLEALEDKLNDILLALEIQTKAMQVMQARIMFLENNLKRDA